MSDAISAEESPVPLAPPAAQNVHGVERVRVPPAGLRLAGLLTLLLGAWAGIVPFLGPSFGYSGDGAGSHGTGVCLMPSCGSHPVPPPVWQVL
jgi:hypothetical protein